MSSFAKLVRTVGAAVVAGILFGLAPVAHADAPQPLTFAQRVECQRRIERIRWMHRTESVAGQHRPFEETVPAELIRAKVETYLLHGEALARYWGRPLSGAQLQAEMERMARSTKAPDRLQELHSALGDDPDVIAECLARPVLTERLIRNGYAYDTRFHGGLRAEAEGAIEWAQGSIEALRTMGHAYSEAVWEHREELEEDFAQSAPRRGEDSPVLPFSSVEWEESVRRLAREFPLTSEVTATPRDLGALVAALPVGTLGRLGEDADRFFVHAVLERSETRLRVATVTWGKRGFDAWWAAARTDLGLHTGIVGDGAIFGALDPVEGGYRPTEITGGACVLAFVTTQVSLSMPAPPRVMEPTAT